MESSKSDMQNKFKLDDKIRGKMSKGSEFPQSPEHPDPVGTLTKSISFEGVIIRIDDKVVFRVTKVNGSANKEIQQVREKGMQVIEVGQVFSVDELTGWDFEVIDEDHGN